MAGVQGVSLHSYRHSRAERAKACGYPQRFAQAALGHSSRAVHEAYAQGAIVLGPALDEYESVSAKKLIRLAIERTARPVRQFNCSRGAIRRACARSDTRVRLR